MNNSLREIIKTSTFKVHSGRWVYASIKGQPSLDDVFMLSKDETEVTAVFEEANTNKIEVIERNNDFRLLFEIKVSKPFYSIGFLAAISSAVAKKGCNVLMVSTYSRDYILIVEEQLDKSKQALLELGFRED